MKKIFDSFYIFSKFFLSFFLLSCVLFLTYLLYINYQNEDKITKNQFELENELRANINENSEYIKDISNEILETKKSLINIEKIIKENANKETKVDLAEINKSITLLNKNFNNLNSEISLIKNKNIENQKNKNPKLIKQSIDEIVELIKIKYENNMNFDKELKYLQTILDKENIPVLEKLSILKINPYKGHIFLENQFNNEVNSYLKSMMKQNNSFLNKIILPYINLSPSSENIIDNEKILILKQIKSHIKNRNITKAYNNLSRIKKYEEFFKISSNEMKNYDTFIKEISRIR